MTSTETLLVMMATPAVSTAAAIVATAVMTAARTCSERRRGPPPLAPPEGWVVWSLVQAWSPQHGSEGAKVPARDEEAHDGTAGAAR